MAIKVEMPGPLWHKDVQWVPSANGNVIHATLNGTTSICWPPVDLAEEAPEEAARKRKCLRCRREMKPPTATIRRAGGAIHHE